ncbi:uncharacterized protein METZ01_LOCUS434239, partial [marine metagenome]
SRRLGDLLLHRRGRVGRAHPRTLRRHQRSSM